MFSRTSRTVDGNPTDTRTTEVVRLTESQVVAGDIDEGDRDVTTAFCCAAHTWHFDNHEDDHGEDRCDVFNAASNYVERVSRRSLRLSVILPDGHSLRFEGPVPEGW